jgi:UDP-hydrolysing UDP-N-acetyl-D-glucosamine 2-epimerase
LRTIAVVTTSRAEYGICRALLEAIQKDPDLHLRLLVSGTHLSPEHGLTIREIQQDGYQISEKIEMLLSSDTPQGISKSAGLGLMGFAQTFANFRPDILVVLGDRYEMHAAALAALPFKIPVAHLSGGELTEGAIDDALRHSLTKLSHLHFPATEEYARRIIQLGEEPWRVVVAGEPSLDRLSTLELLGREDLERKFLLQLDRPFLLVTFHPVTLEYEDSDWQITELLEALGQSPMPAIFTLPNADTGNRVVRQKILEFVARHSDSRLIDNFGIHAYFSMMKLAAAMVGNSSSGIIEAASFELPVVNIGTRQGGRLRASNVIDVGYGRRVILAGIAAATAPEFRASLKGLLNPYCRGNASQIIKDRLKSVELGEALIRKKFYDVPVESEKRSAQQAQEKDLAV